MRADRVRWLCGAVLAALLYGGVPANLCSQQSVSPNPAAPESGQEALPVVSFRVVTAAGQVLRVAGNPISLEIGKPLDRDQLAASLKAHYRTGNYSDIRAVSEPAEGGIRVDFVVKENLYFNQLVLLGLKAPPTEASAAASMQIGLGDV